jgi:hypothetical protein
MRADEDARLVRDRCGSRPDDIVVATAAKCECLALHVESYSGQVVGHKLTGCGEGRGRDIGMPFACERGDMRTEPHWISVRDHHAETYLHGSLVCTPEADGF